MDSKMPEENLQGSHHKYYVEILKVVKLALVPATKKVEAIFL